MNKKTYFSLDSLGCEHECHGMEGKWEKHGLRIPWKSCNKKFESMSSTSHRLNSIYQLRRRRNWDWPAELPSFFSSRHRKVCVYVFHKFVFFFPTSRSTYVRLSISKSLAYCPLTNILHNATWHLRGGKKKRESPRRLRWLFGYYPRLKHLEKPQGRPRLLRAPIFTTRHADSFFIAS